MKQQERWERLAFEFHTRPNKAPRKIGRDDLMIVRGPGSPKMLAGTLLAAVGITAMLVWPISTIFIIVTGIHTPERWYWGAATSKGTLLVTEKLPDNWRNSGHVPADETMDHGLHSGAKSGA